MTKRKGILGVIVAVLVLGLCGAAPAALIAVPNSDFEQGSGTNPQDESAGWWTDSMQNGGTNSNGYLTGWVITVPTYRFGGRWNPRDDHYAGATDPPGDPSPMDGPQAAFLHWGAGVSHSDSTITSYQKVCDIEAGYDYTLTVAVGSSNGTAMGMVHKVEAIILADGVSVATTDRVGPPSNGNWTELSVTMDAATATANAGKALKIQLFAKCYNQEKVHVDWDNVRLDKVPEPAAMSLLALGGVGMLLRRRRR